MTVSLAKIHTAIRRRLLRPRPRPLATWSVVMTVRAPGWMVDGFVRHYVQAGAEEIFIFFDDPTLCELEPHPKVRSAVCDEAHWQGQRPVFVQQRQGANYLRARDLCRSDWLLHVDVDELVQSRQSIGQVLGAVPAQVFSVRVPCREAVYARLPDEGTAYEWRYFKNPRKADDAIVEELFGPDLATFAARGHWGHVAGKAFVRQGDAMGKYALHGPFPADPVRIRNHETRALVLLHFEALSFDLFKEKVALRSKAINAFNKLPDREDARWSLMSSAYASGGDAALLDLYKRFHVLEEAALEKGLRHGFIEERRVGPRAA